MMEIEMPKIAVEENEDRSYAKVTVEPLEKGFGLTLGNALRRILLSALPGVAIQNIKFSEELGIKHEFSSIPKVKEDVTEIILNLKKLVLKNHSEEDQVLYLKANTEGEVFASAILHHAAAIMVAHNHPSGDPKPSIEDEEVTRQLLRSGKVLGIPMIDHVIIGDGNYYSFLENEAF